jgi:hypothetical protein
MKAVIIYDEGHLAESTNAMLARAASRAGGASRWIITPWRGDMLLFPPSADAVLKDAAQAHLIVLAIRIRPDLPSWLLNWLETWAGRRQVQGAALAVFSGGNGDVLSATVTPELSRFAERHGLSLILDGVSPDEDESALTQCASIGKGQPGQPIPANLANGARKQESDHDCKRNGTE